MSQPTITRIFDRDLLLDEWCVLDNPILDRIVSTSRWSVHHEVIFQAPDDGKFYRAEYSHGATEYQDEYPWEDEPQVEAIEVHQVEVTVKQWVPVPAPEGHQPEPTPAR